MAQNPAAGDELKGTGGARKMRFAGRGKGKSGGYRVIYAGKDIPMFLLSIFSKGEKANLSQAERNELKQVLSLVATAYKKGVKRFVQSRQ